MGRCFRSRTKESPDLRAAAQLSSRRSIRPVMFMALLCLIVATRTPGFGSSEKSPLRHYERWSTHPATKFQESRLVPLHESTRLGLKQYLAIRKRTRTTSPKCLCFQARCGAALFDGPFNLVYMRHAQPRSDTQDIAVIGEPLLENRGLRVLWRRRGISAMAVPHGATEPS